MAPGLSAEGQASREGGWPREGAARELGAGVWGRDAQEGECSHRREAQQRGASPPREPRGARSQASAVRSGLPAEVTHGRLHFMPNDEALAAVSSSAARGALAGDDPAAAAVLPECIRAYAKEHGLYE